VRRTDTSRRALTSCAATGHSVERDEHLCDLSERPRAAFVGEEACVARYDTDFAIGHQWSVNCVVILSCYAMTYFFSRIAVTPRQNGIRSGFPRGRIPPGKTTANPKAPAMSMPSILIAQFGFLAGKTASMRRLFRDLMDGDEG